EGVRDSVERTPPDRSPQRLLVSSVEALERAAVGAELVGQRARVEAAARRQRHALVEAEQWLPARRLLLDHDFHVRHLGAQLRRQVVESGSGVLLEALLGLERAFFHFAHRPSLVRRRMPRRRWSARSSSPSFRAPQTKTTPTTARGTANRTMMTTISPASFIRRRVVAGLRVAVGLERLPYELY